MDVENSVDRIARELLAEEADERAAEAKQYLKSELAHYGVRVPTVRAVVTRAPAADRDELVSLAAALWSHPVFELRLAAAELLADRAALLSADDAGLVERMIREARTWALVDVLAPKVMGPMLERHPELGTVLDRWAVDDDFWIRRAALLSLLVPLRRGDGDFERFTWYADSMLDDKEFFVQKAIGWVLRDAGKKRPEMVYEWTLPRAARLSSVSFREAIKPLSNAQRAAVEAARIGSQ